MTFQFGPGARAFVVDYRLSPEDPFPAAVHDVYASYLYLTQPDHGAISPIHKRNQWDHPLEPVDPRDIVLAGDSAGGGLAIAFMLYMRDYVQPGLGTEPTLPSTTILLSVRFTLHSTKIILSRYYILWPSINSSAWHITRLGPTSQHPCQPPHRITHTAMCHVLWASIPLPTRPRSKHSPGYEN